MPRLGAVDVYLKLTAKGQKLNIGMARFSATNPDISEAELSRKIHDVIRNDLLFTKMFNITTFNAAYTGKKEELEYWKNQMVDVVLSAKISVNKSVCSLTVNLINVENGEVMLDKTFKGNSGVFRDTAHNASDEIVLRFTGQKGIARSKIVFVNDASKSKELYVVDYDGYNSKKITGDNSINLFPKWSPDGEKIAYTTYKYGNPDLYMINKDGTGKKALSTFQGLNISPAWSPDGRELALTMSKGKSPNLYVININGEMQRKLTYSNGIDGSACYSPNKREIVFVSDRSGFPQLYIADTDGTNVRRVPTEGYSDSPSWSPKGDKIVYSMRYPGESYFNIYLYDIATDKTIQLTTASGSNEAPSVSLDGKFIVFSSTRNSKKELFVMCIDGTGEHRLAEIKGNSSMPHWSQ